MTSTELFIHIDERTRTLRSSSLKLLIMLIATAHRQRTYIVQRTAQELAKENGLARDTVEQAARELQAAGLIEMQRPRYHLAKLYIMPREWFDGLPSDPAAPPPKPRNWNQLALGEIAEPAASATPANGPAAKTEGTVN